MTTTLIRQVTGFNKHTHVNMNDLIVIKTNYVTKVSRDVTLCQSVIPIIVLPQFDLGKYKLSNINNDNRRVSKPACFSQK